MTADLLISQLLEAAEEGDRGLWLDHALNHENYHRFIIMHPKHGKIGYLKGHLRNEGKAFDIDHITVHLHPNFKKWEHGSDHTLSRTLMISGMRALMKHFPTIERIQGSHRVTGTHSLKFDRTGGAPGSSNTGINIPRRMRQAVA